MPTEVNGALGPASRAGDALVGLPVVEVRDRLVAGVRAVVDPEKLSFARRQLTRPQGRGARLSDSAGLFGPSRRGALHPGAPGVRRG
ncbi:MULTISPECIES: hypothetical protein [Streptomyces]|uniref:hypothetical protein n=1 Tax=Streptomyces TaxID=1883 RepID=UPI00131B369D|nr:hypothetical protein [Streptomyces sp. NRRL S-475]